MTTTARPAPKLALAPAPPPARAVPMDVDLERQVLSAALLDPAALGSVIDIVGTSEVFTDDVLAGVYRVMFQLHQENKPASDAAMILAKARALGLHDRINAAYLLDLANVAGTSAHAEYHAVLIAEMASRRRLISALHAATNDAYDATVDFKTLADSIESRIMQAAPNSAPHEQLTLTETLEKILDGKQSPKGIPSGIWELDAMTLGMHAGEMSVLAARPSVGKTALALTIAQHVAVQLHQPTCLFSLEMRQMPIMQRLLSAQSGVPMQSIRRNTYHLHDRQLLEKAAAELSASEFYIDDESTMTIYQIRAKARRLKKKHGIRLFILDYLQLMDAGERAENRQQEITRISRGIKSIANELDAHFLCLSQLNRASESENRRPRTSDLRESGSIEQDADVVMLLHREDVLNRATDGWLTDPANADKIGMADLLLTKQRNGPCGQIRLIADDDHVRFLNLGYDGN